MSFDAIAWAIRTTTSTSSAKLVLIALADLVRPPAMKAFASATTLCRTTQLDRKTVLLSLRRLEHAALITRLDETAGRGGAPVFRLAHDSTRTKSGTGSSQATSAESGTGLNDGPSRTDTAFPANPSRFSHEPHPKTGHRSSSDPVLNQKRERASRAATSKTMTARFCPPDFSVTAEMRAWAKANVPGVDIELETAKFRDHEFTKVHSDWTAAWRNWMRRAQDFGAKSSSETRYQREARGRVEAAVPNLVARRRPSAPGPA